MQLLANEIKIFAFTPDDGSESAAIRVVHRTNQEEFINNETTSQRENLRRGLLEMVASITGERPPARTVRGLA